MGNESTTVVNHYQYEDLEKIRRESDEQEQKKLLEQKIADIKLDETYMKTKIFI